MTGSSEDFFATYHCLWSMIPDDDKLVMTLAKSFGNPPSKHKKDAFVLRVASTFYMDSPKKHIKCAREIRKAASKLEQKLCALPKLDCRGLWAGFDVFWGSSAPIIEPQSLSSQSYVEPIISGMRVLIRDANRLESLAADYLKMHGPKAKNRKAANRQIANLASDIYFRETGDGTPKEGTEDSGPFPRLLRAIYVALGRENVNLVGPLLSAHEYGKNRHSWG